MISDMDSLIKSQSPTTYTVAVTTPTKVYPLPFARTHCYHSPTSLARLPLHHTLEALSVAHLGLHGEIVAVASANKNTDPWFTSLLA